MTREELIRLAREAAAGVNRPSYCDHPATFDPHEWVLDAMVLAHKAAVRERADEPVARDQDLRRRGPAEPLAPVASWIDDELRTLSPDEIAAALLRRGQSLRLCLAEAVAGWADWEDAAARVGYRDRIRQLRTIAEGAIEPPRALGRGVVLAEVDLDILPRVFTESLTSSLKASGVDADQAAIRHAAASLITIVAAREVAFSGEGQRSDGVGDEQPAAGPAGVAKPEEAPVLGSGCGCDFCTGKKSRADNWCSRCGAVKMQPPKWWENLDVCDACEVTAAAEAGTLFQGGGCPVNAVRRAAPPTAGEVREGAWWWNFPPHGKPHVMGLDIDSDDVVYVVGDSDFNFDPDDWPGDWAPCLPPTGIEQPDAHAQPLPTPNAGPAVVDLVLKEPLSAEAQEVIRARDRIGMARYGTRLQPHNGRDVARDFTDEVADAVVYSRQGLEEAADDVARLMWGRRLAGAVALLEDAVDHRRHPLIAPLPERNAPEPIWSVSKPRPLVPPVFVEAETDELRARLAEAQEDLRATRTALAEARAKPPAAGTDAMLPLDPLCPWCGQPHDIGEIFDGAETRCGSCREPIVASAGGATMSMLKAEGAARRHQKPVAARRKAKAPRKVVAKRGR